ncbi:MAG: hypothetical protein OSJ70_09945 [Bacilli bacterium]|nr:hypothetical protein [Bacilli bacterium]
MEYNKNSLPDFYSVRNKEQIDYSFEGMQNKKCLLFLDNGFCSNIIEPNKRNIKFIWDGFLLFVDKNVSIDDIKSGASLYEERLVALQRMSVRGEKSNIPEIREYIIKKLEDLGIPYEIMPDKKEVHGYPSKCDLWSTRDESVLIDAIGCTGDGEALYFKDSFFDYRITFDDSKLPDMHYEHKGAIVLRGENETAISRLIENDNDLKSYLEGIVGKNKIYSYIQDCELPGDTISNIENKLK